MPPAVIAPQCLPLDPASCWGPRSIDARSVNLELNHCDTQLSWRYAKPDAFTLCGAWHTQRLGEWGLRFWVILCLQHTTQTLWRFDPDSGELSSKIGSRHIVVNSAAKPLLTSFHASQEDLLTELENKGYFFLGSRGTQGPVAALRFNLEEMPDQRFVVALGDTQALARQQAHKALQRADSQDQEPETDPAQAASARCHRLEHRLGSCQSASVYRLEPPLEQPKIRRLRRVAGRCVLPRTDGEYVRPTAGAGEYCRSISWFNPSGQFTLFTHR